jgi:hypothetical protein
MAIELDQLARAQDSIHSIQCTLGIPYWKHADFWILLVVGIASVVVAFMAYFEAGRAKKAATAAGKTVKIQTVMIELTEISQKLERLQPDIRFNEVRNLLSEISRRIIRYVSPFQKDPQLAEKIDILKAALSSAKESLNKVRPSDPMKEAETQFAVYYGIEGDFAAINMGVADLLGLLEKETINFGDKNANS